MHVMAKSNVPADRGEKSKDSRPSPTYICHVPRPCSKSRFVPSVQLLEPTDTMFVLGGVVPDCWDYISHSATIHVPCRTGALRRRPWLGAGMESHACGYDMQICWRSERSLVINCPVVTTRDLVEMQVCTLFITIMQDEKFQRCHFATDTN
jgi:hypothetical protein